MIPRTEPERLPQLNALLDQGVDYVEAQTSVGLLDPRAADVPTIDPTSPPWELCDRLTQLCKMLAPELPHIYVIPASELPDDCPMAMQRDNVITGSTHPGYDVLLRPWLGDRWQGRAPAITLNIGRILTTCASGFAAREIIGTTVHELTHVLETTPPHYSLELSEPEAVVYRAEFGAKLKSFNTRPWSQEHAPVPMSQHFNRFTRVAAHLLWRLWYLGIDVGNYFAGPEFCISHQLDYLDALGDEPRQLKDATFQEIKRTPAPKPFAALWKNDLLSWVMQSPDPQTALAAYAVHRLPKEALYDLGNDT